MIEISERSHVHASFVIERDFDAPLDRVWHALSDSDARDRWFRGGPTFEIQAKAHDFRVGRRAVEEGQWHGGPRSRFESTYTDIVVQQRMTTSHTSAIECASAVRWCWTTADATNRRGWHDRQDGRRGQGVPTIVPSA